MVNRIISKPLTSILLLILVFISTISITSIILNSQQSRSFSIVVWYTLPPAVNWNPLAAQGPIASQGIAAQPCIAPLYAFHPYKGLFFPILAKDMKLSSEGYLEVTLWPDNKWFDGSSTYPLTSKDVWTYFMIQWKIFGNYRPWLKDISIIDDYTIRFYFNISPVISLAAPLVTDPSKTYSFTAKLPPIYYQGIFAILTSGISTPYQVFGRWAEQVKDIPISQLESAVNLTSLQDEIRNFQLNTPWCNGPFWLDPKTITTTGVQAVKNPGYRWARYIQYDRGEWLFARAEEQMVAWMMEGRNIATWHGLSPTVLIEIDKAAGGVKLAYLYNFEVQGIWFNIAKYPFNITEVRQALVMLINATEAGLAFPPMFSLAYRDYITGQLRSSDLPDWITNNLYDWSYNPQKAYQLLESVGFKRGADGKWYMPDGKPFRFQLLCVSAWADWVALASNIASQLQQHGIDVQPNCVDVGVYWGLWGNWQFDVTLNWDVINPLGLATAYTAYLNRLWPARNFDVSKYNLTWPVPLRNGSTIYVNPYFEQQVLQSALPGTPTFWDALAKLTWFWNYYVPTDPLWIVRRSWEISVKMSNYAELLGAPDEIVDVAGYKTVYFGPEKSWLLAGMWGMYAPWLWMSYGILKPPEKALDWPPRGSPKDVLSLIPPEAKVISIMQLVKTMETPVTQTSPVTTTTYPTQAMTTQATVTVPVVTTERITAVSTIVAPVTVTYQTPLPQVTTDWTMTIVIGVILLAVGLAIGYIIRRGK